MFCTNTFISKRPGILAPTMEERYCAQSWYTGNARFNSRLACLLSCSEFSIFSPENRVKTGQDPLERPSTEGTPPVVLGSYSYQLVLHLEFNPNFYLENLNFFNKEKKITLLNPGHCLSIKKYFH